MGRRTVVVDRRSVTRPFSIVGCNGSILKSFTRTVEHWAGRRRWVPGAPEQREEHGARRDQCAALLCGLLSSARSKAAPWGCSQIHRCVRSPLEQAPGRMHCAAAFLSPGRLGKGDRSRKLATEPSLGGARSVHHAVEVPTVGDAFELVSPASSRVRPSPPRGLLPSVRSTPRKGRLSPQPAPRSRP